MKQLLQKILQPLLSVPMRVKLFGIVIVPIFILGLSLNYWITTGLSDWLSYLLPDESVIIAMEAGSRSVLLVTILGAVVAILFALVMMYWLIRPILELQKTANEVSEGKLYSRTKIWSKDEIGEVAASFNEMVDHLVDSQQSIEQTNRQLSLMNEIAQVISKDLDLHDALFEILQSVLNAVELKTGWIYLFDQDRKKFHLATWSGVDDEDKEIILDCDPLKLCTCQEELNHGKAPFIPTSCKCSRFNKDDGEMIEHHSIALYSGNHSLGVLNLASNGDKYFKSYEIDLLTSAADRISVYISKSWFEMKLYQKEEVRKKLMRALIKAQEEERARLAQDLHDGAGQMLTSLLIRMKILSRDLKAEKDIKQVEILTDNISNVIEYIRMISYQNRPVVLEEFGLKRALEILIEDTIVQSGLTVIVDIELKDTKWPREVETTIYRIAQESLTNVIRHAKANKVHVRLWLESLALKFLIKDDGIGFETENIFKEKNKRHLGLVSIKERLELLEGKLEIVSGIGEGTIIIAELPLLEDTINA